jgi:NDP-sugar pyrophosphorylase family protein
MSLYPVVILAGGLATRLRPITEKIPKALVEVGGEPFLFHQLRLLRFHEIREVIISAWYLGDMICDYVGDGRKFGLNVNYVFDGDIPLGTGGAIRQALDLLRGPFYVLYGDSYLPCNYAAIQFLFDAHTQPALMTIYHNHDKWESSNVEMVNGKIVDYNKKQYSPRMEYIDYGLGMFRPSVFDNLPEAQPIDLADIYQTLISSGNLLAYEAKERFYEVGSFEGLRNLDALLTKDPNYFLRTE